MSGPLHGITVIDLTTVLAGPFASMLLADMGAQVIKIEPLHGDSGRSLGPPFQKTESHLFLGMNRNKKSMAVDLKKAEGRDIVLKLAARSDVFMENSRPGTMEKLGLGYDTLSAINPRLIYSSTTGFGTAGPHTDKAAYELVLQGYASVMDRGENPPQRDKSSVVDMPSGLMAAVGILAALYNRQETGEGQRVDTSLLGSAMAMQAHRMVMGEDRSQPAFDGTTGNHPAYRTYQTSDGYINVAVLNEGLFKKLCRTLGVEELGDDPRFNSHANRFHNAQQLIPVFQKILQQKTSPEWTDLLEEAGVPCGPVNTIDDLFNDEHILANQLLIKQTHPVAGDLQTLGFPLKMEKTPVSVESPAPLLGEHTEDILDWLGYDKREIEALKEKVVVLTASSHPVPERSSTRPAE